MTGTGPGDPPALVVRVAWRGSVDDEELVSLTRSHGGRAERGW